MRCASLKQRKNGLFCEYNLNSQLQGWLWVLCERRTMSIVYHWAGLEQ